MNGKPKGIWRRPFGLFFWFIFLTCASSFVFFFFCFCDARNSAGSVLFFTSVYSICITLAMVLAILFARRLCCWRNFRRFLWGLAGLSVLMALFYAEENLRGKWAWEKFKREWEAKGEKFDLVSLAPPPVPDDQNFALSPIVAGGYRHALNRNGRSIRPRKSNVANPLEMSLRRADDNYRANTPRQSGSWLIVKLTDLKRWQDYYRATFQTNVTRIWSNNVSFTEEEIEPLSTNEFPTAPQPQTPAADVLLALSKYDATIEELRQGSHLPYSRFPFPYDAEIPPRSLMPHLSVFRECPQMLQLRVVAELEAGQGQKALDDVKLLLRFTDSIRTEPFLISQLVRIKMWQITLQPIWEGLAKHQWSDAQLAELERKLGRLDFLADYQFSLRGERACALRRVTYAQQHRSNSDLSGSLFASATWRIFECAAYLFPSEIYYNTEWFSSFGFLDNFSASVVPYIPPSGWYYQSELTIGEIYQQRLLKMTDPEEHLFSSQAARNADIFLRSSLLKPSIAGLLLPDLSFTAKRFAFAQSSVDLARVAIALERYRFAHGEYPESLDVLAPQFIAKVPHDIINGQPLKYRRTDDGQFVLYSVGWNEKDDNGVVGLRKSGSVDIEKGDWVWRYPANCSGGL